MRPPKPPIVHRLKARRAGQRVSPPYRFDDVGPMFWAAVAVLVALAIGIVLLGGRA